MAAAKTAPAWLVPGADVWEVHGRAMDGYLIRKVHVERLTATQAVTTIGSAEVRWRLSTLRRIGVDFYASPELAGPDDPRVIDTQVREQVSAAMHPLTEALEEYRRGARLYTKELAKAREVATAIRDAAQHALDNFPAE